MNIRFVERQRNVMGESGSEERRKMGLGCNVMMGYRER